MLRIPLSVTAPLTYLEYPPPAEERSDVSDGFVDWIQLCELRMEWHCKGSRQVRLVKFHSIYHLLPTNSSLAKESRYSLLIGMIGTM